MAMIAQSLQERIQEIMDELSRKREEEGRTERARLISIAITNLETAKLYIKESATE